MARKYHRRRRSSDKEERVPTPVRVQQATTPQPGLNLKQMTPNTILQLQSIIGNYRVQRLLAQRDMEAGDILEADDEAKAARGEWDTHKKIHYHFDKGFEQYLAIRPAYQRAGISNPAEYIANNIVEVTFFGHKTPAHRDLQNHLQQAENALKKQNITPDIRSFWSFVPRPIRGSTKLSEHARGRAFDINPKENPRIIKADDVLVIKAITGVNMASSQNFETLVAASKSFQKNFNQSWITQQEQALKSLQMDTHPSSATTKKIAEIKQLLAAIKRRRTDLNGYAITGLLNLQQSLIDALGTAGFEWGGNFVKSKDFMHFELP
jgi:hypothetical protein